MTVDRLPAGRFLGRPPLTAEEEAEFMHECAVELVHHGLHLDSEGAVDIECYRSRSPRLHAALVALIEDPWAEMALR